MKRIIFGFFMLCFSGGVMSCDICALYDGVFNNDLKHRIGLWHRARFLEGTIMPFEERNLEKHLEANEEINLGKVYRETYSTFEIRGAYRISDRWFIAAYVPVVQKTRWIDNELAGEASGLGDPSLMVQFSPVLTKTTEGKSFKHRMTSGLGIKFPLAQTQIKWEDEYLDHDLQPGSGSYDVLLKLEYQARYKNLGLQLFGFSTLTTENLSSYRYGNNLSTAFLLYYQQTLGTFKIAPTLGFNKEFIGKDHSYSEPLENSGGEYLFSTYGMDIRFKNVSIQGSYHLPIKQEYNGVQLPVDQKFELGLTYAIQ